MLTPIGNLVEYDGVYGFFYNGDNIHLKIKLFSQRIMSCIWYICYIHIYDEINICKSMPYCRVFTDACRKENDIEREELELNFIQHVNAKSILIITQCVKLHNLYFDFIDRNSLSTVLKSLRRRFYSAKWPLSPKQSRLCRLQWIPDDPFVQRI